MAELHLVKLCVGVDNVAELARRQSGRGGAACHVTRQWPRRSDALLDGGSLYWVIRGQIAARQRITALERLTGPDGAQRCAIRLEARLHRTRPTPRRPFQGWRYLKAADAPPDLDAGGAASEPDLPAPLAQALNTLGVV